MLTTTCIPVVARARSQALRLTTVLFAVLCTTALVACGDDGDEAAAGDQTYRVVQVPSSKSEFTATINHYAAEEADKRGIDYKMQIPAAVDVASQTATVNAVIASKPDAILVEPVDKEGMVGPLTQAKRAGIKVVTYDSNIEATDVPEAYISTDYVEGGREIARQLLSLTGGKGKMLHLQLISGLAFSDNLLKGYEEVMSKAPGVTQLPTGITQVESSKAASIVSAALSRNPDLAGLFVGTLTEQQGALSALRSAGAVGKVKTVAWDANPDTVEKLREGIWDVVISTRAGEYGRRLIETAEALLSGDDVESEQLLKACVITKETVDSSEVKPCIYLPID